MRKNIHQAGGIWLEVVVAIFIVIVLWFVFWPAFVGTSCLTSAMRRGQLTQGLSNMKQLHFATQQMVLDRQLTNAPNLGWPGDTGGTFTNWVHALLAGNYLTTNDLCKFLSAPDIIVTPDQLSHQNNAAVRVYAVSTNSLPETVFLTSANFTNTPAGGVPPLASARPYGEKDLIVFHVAGDGAIYPSKQAGKTNIIGAYAPLCP